MSDDKTVQVSPVVLRSRQIRAAAESGDLEQFLQAAKAERQLKEDKVKEFVFWEQPRRGFYDEDGCPHYVGAYNGGCFGSVVCALVQDQLNQSLEFIYCSIGRNVRCPIYQSQKELELV